MGIAHRGLSGFFLYIKHIALDSWSIKHCRLQHYLQAVEIILHLFILLSTHKSVDIATHIPDIVLYMDVQGNHGLHFFAINYANMKVFFWKFWVKLMVKDSIT